jgi:two-component system cell cycle sensor histidine kinase/response regulator CckA
MPSIVSDTDELRRDNTSLRALNEQLLRRVAEAERAVARGEISAVVHGVLSGDALRRSEALFRAVIEKSSDAISLTGHDGKTRYLTPSVARVLGWTPEQMLTRTPREQVVPEDQVRLADALARLMKSGERDMLLEFRVKHRDGSIRWIESSGTNLLDDPDVGAIVGSYRDITARKRAEEATRESFRRLEEAQAIAHVGSWTADLGADETLLWSRECYRIFGVPEGTPMTRASFFAHVYPADRDEVERASHDAVANGTAYSIEHRVAWPCGDVRWVLERAVVERDADGRATHMKGTVQDITERRRAEEQLRQSHKMESVGRLADGVAHDFNNLLAVILSYADIALEDLKADDPTRDDVAQIREAACRATTLTQQLLAFSRQQVLQARVMDVNAAVAGMEQMLGRVLGEGIELTLRPAGDLGRVVADPGQIEQVVMNLAVNARDAMPNGGLLTIETANVGLDAAYASAHLDVVPGRYVKLAVHDSGVGMDSATRARIFEPFFTTKEVGKGTGLGLATVFGIVRQSGGHVGVVTSPGRGSTFEIYLPRTERTFETPAAPAPPLALGGTETILLVEDEDQVRAVACAILRRHGYRVLDASSGAHALAVSKDFAAEIHLMLTDVMMPRMNGRKLVEEIAPSRPRMKVLLASGYTDDAVVRDGVRGAEIAFLQKPFTPATLLREVRLVLDGRQESRVSSLERAAHTP